MSSQMGALLASGPEGCATNRSASASARCWAAEPPSTTRAVLVCRAVSRPTQSAGIRGDLAPAAAAGDTENSGVQMLACPGVVLTRPTLRRPADDE
jgi:hypothetical protein